MKSTVNKAGPSSAKLKKDDDQTDERYKLPYNPEPLEEDSDPDFNPGVYVPEVKKKGRGAQIKARGTRKRRSGRIVGDRHEESGDEDFKLDTKTTRAPVARRVQGNPLLEFFADLGLQSATETDADDEDERGSSENDSDDEERPPLAETIARLVEERARRKSQSQSQSQSQSRSQPKSQAQSKSQSRASPSQAANPPEDDSVTEPEFSEHESTDTKPQTSASQGVKRKSSAAGSSPAPSAKKAKVETDDSDTEPGSDSETEPEDDPEGNPFVARPTFVRKPDQPMLGPMVLDARKRIQVPGSISTFLRDYQRDGVNFFWERYKEGRGGLLGDDMGLGKTIQVISFLAAIMHKTGDSRDVDRRRKHVSILQESNDWKKNRRLPPANKTWPTALIIAPSSVVPNWEREFETWGYFEVGAYSTIPGADRKDVLKDFKMGRLDVVVTSFDLARRDIDLLDTQAWSVVIIDEAHRVKNPKSKLTIAFNRFDCQCRFGLTGTAIQNDYQELWTILDWTNPGAVGTKKQWDGFVARPLTRGQSKSASEDERVMAIGVAKILRDKLLPKYFLRRTKALIKNQLPEKIDQVVFCPLTRTQTELYKRIIATDAVQNLVRKDERCDCGSKKSRKGCCHPYDKSALFRYMSTLIKISNHLALILPAPNDTTDQIARNRELTQEAFPNGNAPKFGPAMLEPKFCGKWLVLLTLLKEWHKDPSNKVLIFTKSVKLLDMLEFHLDNQSLGFVTLKGATKQSERMPIIDQFHTDPKIFVFLISTLAGGTGLNLTGANKVVIFDPNWNPAHDLQAMDRAYRFGQTRDVEVYRLLGAGSLEELIYARQVYKQQQMAVGYDASLQTRYFEGVQGDKGRQGELFGIKNIFKLHEGTLATKQAIERANLVDLDWAFANLDAHAKTAPNPTKKSNQARWVYEAEAKCKKDYGELRGLGALLFDDETPELEGETDIQKALADIGVNYTHRNEDLIVENVIEKKRVEVIKETRKRVKREAKAKKEQQAKKKSSSPEPQWPPKRKHHRAPPPPGPQEKLMHRREALVELGFISSAAEIYDFAQEFLRKPPEEQEEIIAQLDEFGRMSAK